MRVSNAAVCTQVEQTHATINLKGVFSEIVQDPIPTNISCHLVIGLVREADEQAGAPRRLRVDLVNKDTDRFVRIGEGPAAVPQLTSALIVKIGNLPLDGEGAYNVRVIDVTDPQQPIPLIEERPVFVVKLRSPVLA